MDTDPYGGSCAQIAFGELQLLSVAKPLMKRDGVVKLAVATTVAILAYRLRKVPRRAFMKLRLWTLDKAVVKLDHQDMLSAVRKWEPPPAKEAGGANHGHPLRAANRYEVVRKLVDDRVTLFGSDSGSFYDLASSKVTRGLGINGQRLPYWLEDLTQLSYGEPGVDDIFLMVYQDHHLSKKDILALGPRVLVLVTAEMDGLSYTDTEVTMVRTGVTKVHTEVTGGAKYDEEMFQYRGVDRVMFQGGLFSDTPFAWTSRVVTINSAAPGTNVVFIIPEMVFHLPISVISRLMLADDPRLPQDGFAGPTNVWMEGEFLLCAYKRSGVQYVSIKKAESLVAKHYEVPASCLERLLERNRRKPLLSHEVGNFLRSAAVTLGHEEVAILDAFLRSDPGLAFADTAVNYCLKQGTTFDKVKSVFTAVAAPPVGPMGAGPAKCEANEQAAVKGRLTDIANPNDELLPKVKVVLVKLLDYLCPVSEAGTWEMMGEDYILDHAPTAGKRLKLLEASDTALTPAKHLKGVTAHIKSEPAKGDPRLIISAGTDSQLELGKYAKPMILKLIEKCPGVCVGLNRQEIAGVIADSYTKVPIDWSVPSKSVQDALSGPYLIFGDDGSTLQADEQKNKHWCGTDFSRMDARTHAEILVFIQRLAGRGFPKPNSADLVKALGKLKNVKTWLSEGTPLVTTGGIVSGSLITSYWGTIAHVIVFTTARMLGVDLKEAASYFGMLVEDEPIVPGRCGFLSDFFHESDASVRPVLDLKRAFTSLSVQNVTKPLELRLYAYEQSHGMIPLMGEWINAIRRLKGIKQPTVAMLENIWTLDKDAAYHLSTRGGDCADTSADDSVKEEVCRQLSMSWADVEQLVGRVKAATTLEELADANPDDLEAGRLKTCHVEWYV